MNRFKETRKQDQLEVAEKQSRSLLPNGYHDDEDYLSGTFVDQQPTTNIGSKRAVQPRPSKATSKKSKAANAEEKLQEGMNTPLPQDNVGLRMLKLMGYKEGHGIGKSADGITAPIAVVKKTDRAGLGQAERQSEAHQRLEQWTQARVELLEQCKEDFQVAMSNRFAERRVASNLTKAMKTIETLDTRAGREMSCLWWTSIEEEENKGMDARIRDRRKEGVDEPSNALLATGTEIHTVHTQEEAAAAVPQGQTECGGEEEREGLAIVDGKHELWDTLSTSEKLSVATAYLRQEHRYCLFCGHQYGSIDELRKECPGKSEDDH